MFSCSPVCAFWPSPLEQMALVSKNQTPPTRDTSSKCSAISKLVAPTFTHVCFHVYTTRMLETTLIADFDEYDVPKVESLINIDVTCAGGGVSEDSASAGPTNGSDSYPASWSSSASSSPCSEGSTCLDGIVGVYCLCYVRESSIEEVGV